MMGASQVMGAVGSHQSAQAQANAQNAASRASYKHQLQIREHNWLQTRNQWEVKKHEYAQQQFANNEEAAKVFQSQQEVLNQKMTAAMFKRQDSDVAAGKALGKAAMVNDNSGRQQQSVIAEWGRKNAQITAMLTDATYQTKSQMDQTAQKASNANMQGWNKVSVAPVLGVAPKAPTMVAGPSGLSLAAGIMGGVASAAGGIMQNQAPQAYGFDNPVAPGGTDSTFGNTMWNPMNTPTLGTQFNTNYTPTQHMNFGIF